MHRRRNGVKKLERAREAVDLWSFLAYSGLRYPILAFRCGRGPPGAIALPLEVKPMHPRLISARPTSAGARAHVGFATWLTTWSNDLRARPRCEHGNGYAIAPLAHATPRLKVRVSPLCHRRERSRTAAKSTSPFVRFSGPPESFRFLYLSRRTSSPWLRETAPSKTITRSERRCYPSLKNIALRKDPEITNAGA